MVYFIKAKTPKISGVNCSIAPPERPATGTQAWNQSVVFGTVVTYTCGPSFFFRTPQGDMYKEAAVECVWNKTWVSHKLDQCVGKKCYKFDLETKYYLISCF